MADLDDLRYPVGKFQFPAASTPASRAANIETLRLLPQRLRAAVNGLNDAQLDTPYREGGWTVRQVVHHFADSHANSYIRFKLALTEDTPTIKPYDEAAWARLPDSQLPTHDTYAIQAPFGEARAPNSSAAVATKGVAVPGCSRSTVRMSREPSAPLS